MADPLTHQDLQPGHYWSCEFPEKPPTESTSWSHLCRACVVHGMACIANGAQEAARTVHFKAATGGTVRPVSYGDLLAFLLGEMDDDLSPAAVAMQKRSGPLGGDAARGARALGVASRP